MILNDQQRDALITEITGTIRDNERTKVLFLDELVKGRSNLFVMCWNDYQEQSDEIFWRRPFYVPDDRGTFGFMRLRDDKGRVLGYEGDADGDPTDECYKPSAADKRKISAIMESGTPLYYYISDELAISLGIVLTEYTKPAVYEFERKRHRRIDINDPDVNNSALYVALYHSYFTQYGTMYDLPTMTAGTDARKGYYARLIQKAANGELSIKQIWHFPYGKGLHPKEWNNGLPDNFDFGIMSVRMAIGYNSYVQLNGQTGFPDNESDAETMERADKDLFWKAIR